MRAIARPVLATCVMTTGAQEKSLAPGQTSSATDSGWPRKMSNGDATLIAYQPQVDAWRGLKKLLATYAVALMLLLLCATLADAQESDTTAEFWPETDLFAKLGEKSRLFVMYAATRQENLRSYADGQTGIYVDVWALPALRPRLRAHPDASRSKLLMLRSGYLYSRPKNESGAATEHMWTSEGTGRAHLPAALLISDRNRFDLRWVNGDFRWRYRNRLKLERTFPTGRFELTPYAHGEVFYSMDSREWTRLRYAAGMEWSVTRRLVLEGYYLRQNDWTSVPQFVNALGFAVQLYLR